MKRLLPILLALLFLAPLLAEEWTVLVYMAADNNLWQNAVQDVNDMESVALPANLNLVVQTDLPAGSAYPGGERRKIRSDSSSMITSPLVSDLGEIDSGDPQTLKNFVNWGFQRYPATRKMLVIWGHGDNWFKQDEGKWICPDEGSQSIISVSEGELREALAGIPRLDILLFDACSMQSLEVLAEVMDSADYVVGSEELVPVAGFPYQTVIPLFSGHSVEEIAALIPQRYLESYEPGGIQNPDNFFTPLTCSAVRTGSLQSFYNAFRDFAVSSSDSAFWLTTAFRPELWEMNTAYCDVDIGEMLNSFSQWTEDSAPLLSARLSQLLIDWNGCVVFRDQINIDRDVGSAALWFPWHRQYFDGWWRHYRNLEFASTQWLRFLNLGLGDQVAPETPALSNVGTVLGTLQMLVTQPADPDSLEFHVYLRQGGNEDYDVTVFKPGYAEESFWVRIPVEESGDGYLKCVDTCGNWSDPIAFSYEFSEPGLELLIAPNPVRDRSLARAGWYLPEGAEGQVELSVYNIRGQLVMRRSFVQNNSGEGNWLLSAETDFTSLGRGVYFMGLKAGHKTLLRRFTLL